MKLMDMIASYTTNPRIRAKLKKRIKLDDGTVFKKGTVSQMLIKKDGNTYHFEADHSACTVTADEIEMI